MAAADNIRHVILFMLENRSFDQMFGCLKQLNADIDGFDPDHPFTNPDPKSGKDIAQQADARYVLGDDVDIGHEPENVDAQLALSGQPMSGFVADFRASNKNKDDDDLAVQVMAYFPCSDASGNRLSVLHELARQFTVCDRWFSSIPGPTWPNRLFALTGTSAGWRHMPAGLGKPGAPYTYGQDTIFDRLADKGLTGRVYSAGTISMTLILRKTWRYSSLRQTIADFYADVAGPEVNFPAFSLVEPEFFTGDASDQHPPHDVLRGEALLADVYQRLRANQPLWESTLLVVVYDEHGGFFDHVKPSDTVAPDDASQDGFDFKRLGVRVPAVLVSPWLPATVCHTQFDHTSVLRYVCDKWGLVPLGRRAQGANSVSQAFANAFLAPRQDTPEVLQAGTPEEETAPTQPNANQLAIATTVDVMSSELGLSEPIGTTRAFATETLTTSELHQRAVAQLGSVEAHLAATRSVQTLKVLAVHGVGHGDQKTAWQDQWRKIIVERVRARPGAAEWTVEVNFASYDEIFENYPLGPKEIGEALVRLGGGLMGGLLEPQQRGLVSSLENLDQTLRWTAGMVIQWVDSEQLRADLRASLANQIARYKPDLIAAHSLGSLISYDLFRQDVAAGKASQYNDRILMTFGSQIAHPAVLPVFDGRVAPLYDSASGDGFEHWFHLFNANDVVFTHRLPIEDARTSNLETDFLGLAEGGHDLLSHDGASYLSNAGNEPVWIDVTGSEGAKGIHPPFAAGIAAAAPQSPAVIRTMKTTHRALLVGINDYPDPKNQLHGCVNDTFLVSSVLQDLGVEAEEIRLVLDDRATRSGILSRLEWLMDGVRPGDTRIFFYSGHGAQIPSYNNRSVPDEMHETLVPYDFDWSPEHAFMDDDFRKFYSQLPYDTHFFVAFDCCHAGGMARGRFRPRGIDPPDDVRHRALRWSSDDQMWVPRDWVPRQPRPHRLYVPKKVVLATDSGMQFLGQAARIRTTRLPGTDEGAVRNQFGHSGPFLPLMLFACGKDQLASEYEHGSVSYGAFTFAFAKLLRESRSKPRKLSLKDVLSKTGRELYRLGYDQQPEMVGPDAKYPATEKLLNILGK
ncbi:MAG: alkaline phosphatase family protein [Thiobacillaceae bacterium]